MNNIKYFSYTIIVFGLFVSQTYADAGSDKSFVRETGERELTTRVEYCSKPGECVAMDVCYQPFECTSPILSKSERYVFFFKQKFEKGKPNKKYLVIYDAAQDEIKARVKRMNDGDYTWVNGENIVHIWSAGSDDTFIDVININGKEVWSTSAPHISISKDGKYLVAFSYDQTPVAVKQPVTVFSLPKGKELASEKSDVEIANLLGVLWSDNEVKIQYQDSKSQEKVLELKFK